MSGVPTNLRAVLAHNIGFDEPDRWLDYAIRHGFKPVDAVRVVHCPDCSADPKRRSWGQYIFYSTLIHLLECSRCGLIWADVHFDAKIIQQHFESAYKDATYFQVTRKAIFDSLAMEIDGVAPLGARLLDIGGARGDLMARVVARRPDLTATVHDISGVATRLAESRFGFATLTGDASMLAEHPAQYDVVVLSDVLYYEPRLSALWSALSRLIRPGGAVVIRVPNRAGLVRLGQLAFTLTHRREGRALQNRVKFHNPEHIYLLRPHYLRERLVRLGFERITFRPSPLLSNTGQLGRALFGLATAVNKIPNRHPVITPSMLIIGTGRSDPSWDPPRPGHSSIRP